MLPWKERVDYRVFFASAFLALPFIAVGILTPDLLAAWSSRALAAMTRTFGWFFLSSVNLLVLICLLIALSPLGSIRLGADNEKPQHSRFTWLAMLFSAGMGIGLVFWSIAEPLNHFSSPPQGTAGTVEAARQALSIFYFHWGLHAWAVYVAVGLPLAYFQFRRGCPAIISACFRRCLPGSDGETASLRPRPLLLVAIDVLAVWATVMGVVTSLGLGAIQITKGLSIAYGLPAGSTSTGILIACITLLFVLSAVSGVDRGIKVLSQLNVVLMTSLFGLFLLYGPFSYLAGSFFQALGDYLLDLVPHSTSLTLYDNPQWTKDWTIFYWAWWIAWAPFVGAFVATISRGRTVREFILGVMSMPPLLSFAFTTALGGTALHMQMFEQVPLVTTVGDSIEAALFATLQHLPHFGLTAILANLLIISFFVTSADSATMVISTFTTGGRHSCGKTYRFLVIFWGLVLGIMAWVLVVSGGVKALQSASIIGALPFVVVMFALLAVLIRELVREKYRI